MFFFQLPLLHRSTSPLARDRPNPSLRNPRIGFGHGGETEELGQDELATPSLFAVLNALRILVPHGVMTLVRVVREYSSFFCVHSAGSYAA